MSITHQKSRARQEIHDEIERRLKEKPEDAHEIAMRMTRTLSGKMTLRELRAWCYHLFDAEREAARYDEANLQLANVSSGACR